MIFLVALRHDSRVAEVIGYYSLYSVLVRVVVKRPILYVFGSHKRGYYRLNGYACQPIKKFFYSLTRVKNNDNINPVVSEKPKKPRAMVDWNTGQRVHKPKKGKGSYDRGVVKRQDGSLQKSN